MQGVGQLDSELSTLRNFLTTSSVLVHVLKDVAAPQRTASLSAAPKEDPAAPTAADLDWAQTTDGLR